MNRLCGEMLRQAVVSLVQRVRWSCLVFQPGTARELFAPPVTMAPTASTADVSVGRLGTVGRGLWVGTWSLVQESLEEEGETHAVFLSPFGSAPGFLDSKSRPPRRNVGKPRSK